MNIVHLVVVETLSAFWNLEEPFKIQLISVLFWGPTNLVKIGTQQLGPFVCDTTLKISENEKLILSKTPKSSVSVQFQREF